MSEPGEPLPYQELVDLVDRILDECDDEVPCITQKLEALDEATLSELFVSDLLNAFQVFWFMFRTEGSEFVRDKLELEPASSLRGGILVEETDLLEMYFGIREGKPLIAISDGDKVVAAFSGSGAYAAGCEFLKNPEWQ